MFIALAPLLVTGVFNKTEPLQSKRERKRKRDTQSSSSYTYFCDRETFALKARTLLKS